MAWNELLHLTAKRCRTAHWTEAWLSEDGRFLGYSDEAPEADALEFDWHPIPSEGMIAYSIEGDGFDGVFEWLLDPAEIVEYLLHHEDRERGTCDVLLLVECDGGKEPDTWISPGEYWQTMQIMGAVDMQAVTPKPELQTEGGKRDE